MMASSSSLLRRRRRASPFLLLALLSLVLSPPCASVPQASFLDLLHSTIDQIRQVAGLVSSISGPLSPGLRLSSAISDCLELLDFSADEISSSASGARPSDLRSWLSAALSNQDTCEESLSSAGAAVFASPALDSITSLLSQAIQLLPPSAARTGPAGALPAWVDRRLLDATAPAADVIVAKDGSGNYLTVGEAVQAAPEESRRRFVIYVKRGIYVENVEVKKKKWNLMIVGDGINKTVISASRSFADGWTTFRSATFAVSGKGFIARDVTFENTAGPSKHQAVAVRSDSDLSVFYRCSIAGFQDTLYAHSLRQFYRDCVVSGTVDYVFGNAAAVFQNCLFLSRRPLQGQKNTVTAQGRKDPNQNTGFVLQFCNVSADADLAAAANQTETYLGRPWKEFSRTAVMQSYLGGLVRREGWLPWDGDFALATLDYDEYMNIGPGSGLAGRVNWPGFRILNTTAQAANFSVARFIDGDLWLPSTGVKYTSGLLL